LITFWRLFNYWYCYCGVFTASNCDVRLNNVIVSPPVISGPNIATSFLSFVITLENYDRSTKYRQDSANIW